jgi:predicted RNase H-like HicB family nuclease
MKKLHVPVLIQRDEDGSFIVSCPLYRGCHTYGKTIDEALEQIREVIAMCIEESGTEDLNTYVGYRELDITQES